MGRLGIASLLGLCLVVVSGNRAAIIPAKSLKCHRNRGVGITESNTRNSSHILASRIPALAVPFAERTVMSNVSWPSSRFCQGLKGSTVFEFSRTSFDCASLSIRACISGAVIQVSTPVEAGPCSMGTVCNLGSCFTQHRYGAYIIRWPVISGSGDTPQQARAGLEQMFETVKQNRVEEGKMTVRPGAKIRIEFASQEKVSSNPELSDDFIQRVLGLEGAWISDESSLWDFHTEPTNDRLYAKIREVYGVDVSDIESAKLWAIFERIEESRRLL